MSGYRLFIILLAACGAIGCQTAKPLPAINLSEPGWVSARGQAVWRPNNRSPELAGDIMIDAHSDGRSLVQFSKTPFPIAVAQTSSNYWSLQFPSQHLSYSGRGRGPLRVVWLQVAGIPFGKTPSAPWSLSKQEEGHWRLENQRTGEYLEAFLGP